MIYGDLKLRRRDWESNYADTLGCHVKCRNGLENWMLGKDGFFRADRGQRGAGFCINLEVFFIWKGDFAVITVLVPFL